MDSLQIIRAAMVGFAWGGSFFLIAAIIFPIFPLPLLFNLYKYSSNYALGKLKEDSNEGIKWHDRSAQAMRVLALGIWLLILAGYLYSLVEVLGWYMQVEPLHFWAYYGIAAFLPTLWFIRKIFKAWYRGYFYDDLRREQTASLQQQANDELPISQQLRQNKL